MATVVLQAGDALLKIEKDTPGILEQNKKQIDIGEVWSRFSSMGPVMHCAVVPKSLATVTPEKSRVNWKARLLRA